MAEDPLKDPAPDARARQTALVAQHEQQLGENEIEFGLDKLSFAQRQALLDHLNETAPFIWRRTDEGLESLDGDTITFTQTSDGWRISHVDWKSAVGKLFAARLHSTHIENTREALEEVILSKIRPDDNFRIQVIE